MFTHPKKDENSVIEMEDYIPHDNENDESDKENDEGDEDSNSLPPSQHVFVHNNAANYLQGLNQQLKELHEDLQKDIQNEKLRDFYHNAVHLRDQLESDIELQISNNKKCSQILLSTALVIANATEDLLSQKLTAIDESSEEAEQSKLKAVKTFLDYENTCRATVGIHKFAKRVAMLICAGIGFCVGLGIFGAFGAIFGSILGPGGAVAGGTGGSVTGSWVGAAIGSAAGGMIGSCVGYGISRYQLFTPKPMVQSAIDLAITGQNYYTKAR